MEADLRNKNKIMIPNKLLLEQVLEYIGQGRWVIISVKGKSMKPFLREGDRVLLKPFDRTELSQGVIVLAKADDQMVLHRVVRYDNTTVWLAGDGNLVQHERVNYTDVVATAVSLYRGEREVGLNQRWSCRLGHIWYRTRFFRRIMSRLF